jgi:hypothetical protein
MLVVRMPGLALDDKASEHISRVGIFHAVPGLLADAMGKGELDDFRASPQFIGDHRH